jgi:hypothetical protein
MCSTLICRDQREVRLERGSEGPGLVLSAGVHTSFFAGEGGFGYVIVAVSWQDVRQGS